MSTLAELRAELAAALEAAGIRVDQVIGSGAVPYAVIYGQGIAARPGPGGQRSASFRIVLVAGKVDVAASVAELGDLAERALTALWGLPGFPVGDVGPDTIRRTSAGELLTADVVASALFTPAIP